MPIKIPATLPGRIILEHEGVPLILEERAAHQDIRPLQIAILNLMPDKAKTETQLLRALGATPLQIEITFLHAATHKSKNTSQEHLDAFYQTHADVAGEKFDGLIITGAPVGLVAYEDVTFWKEFKDILAWADSHVYSTLYICWAAHAAIFHHNKIDKHVLPAKRSGVYRHHVLQPFDPLVRGFDDFFYVPVSRHTEVFSADIAAHSGLDILVESEEAGPCIVHDAAHRRTYVFNHLEYDAETLQREYERDKNAGLNPALPHNYFPDNNPNVAPIVTWRAHRSLLFSNWINSVYQGTPYDLSKLGVS